MENKRKYLVIDFESKKLQIVEAKTLQEARKKNLYTCANPNLKRAVCQVQSKIYPAINFYYE